MSIENPQGKDLSRRDFISILITGGVNIALMSGGLVAGRVMKNTLEDKEAALPTKTIEPDLPTPIPVFTNDNSVQNEAPASLRSRFSAKWDK